MKNLLGLQEWCLFKYAELTEVVSQMKNCLSIWLIKFKLVTLMMMWKNYKAKFIHKSDKIYPKDALHMYAENEPTVKKNEAVLNHFLGDL